MPHLDPVPLEQVQAQDIRERFEHYRRTRGFTPNSIMTMVRRPGIVRAFMDLNQAVLYEGTVPHETKMLVSLASSLASGCLYCQSHMANLSSIYQASDQKTPHSRISRLTRCSQPAERAAIRLGFKAACQPNEASASDFEDLKNHYDDGQSPFVLRGARMLSAISGRSPTRGQGQLQTSSCRWNLGRDDSYCRQLPSPSGWRLTAVPRCLPVSFG
jgi:alkylhydroperoxidase family enzyme